MADHCISYAHVVTGKRKKCEENSLTVLNIHTYKLCHLSLMTNDFCEKGKKTARPLHWTKLSNEHPEKDKRIKLNK